MDADTQTPQADEPTRTDINLTAQAARQQWPIAAATQARITEHLADLIVATSKPRTAIAAAKALSAYGRLALDQQKLDTKAAPTVEEETPTDIDLRDILDTMDEYRAARQHVLSLWNDPS